MFARVSRLFVHRFINQYKKSCSHLDSLEFVKLQRILMMSAGRSKIRGLVALVLKLSTWYLKLRIYWANLTLAFIWMGSQNERAVARFNFLHHRCGRHAKHLHAIPACGNFRQEPKNFLHSITSERNNHSCSLSPIYCYLVVAFGHNLEALKSSTFLLKTPHPGWMAVSITV